MGLWLDSDRRLKGLEKELPHSSHRSVKLLSGSFKKMIVAEAKQLLGYSKCVQSDPGCHPAFFHV